MDELMSIGRIELAESMPLGCIGPSQLKDLAYTARAAHMYKAEVGRLKKEVETLTKDCLSLADAVIAADKENASLKKDLAIVNANRNDLIARHTRPATDWRGE